MYVCMYVCTYVSMHVCMHACMHHVCVLFCECACPAQTIQAPITAHYLEVFNFLEASLVADVQIDSGPVLATCSSIICPLPKVRIQERPEKTLFCLHLGLIFEATAPSSSWCAGKGCRGWICRETGAHQPVFQRPSG